MANLLWTGMLSTALQSASGCAEPRALGPSPPHIAEISPLGVRRGFATQLTVHGSALSGNVQLIAPFRFAVAVPQANDADSVTFTLCITVDPATPLGVYPIRVYTEAGLSDPFPLAVGQLPQIHEKEDNDNIDWRAKEADWTAQRITLPTVIEGELPEKDSDNFRFRALSGQRIFADILCARIGSGIDSDLWLGSLDREYQAGIHLLAGDPADAFFFTLIPADGEYLFSVDRSTYRPIKTGRPVYRLTLGALPAAAEVYPRGGKRGETVAVEVRGGTLDGPTIVPVSLAPEPGESIMRLEVPTSLRGPDGQPLVIEALPPLLVGDLPEVVEPTDAGGPPLKVTPPLVLNGRIDPPTDEDLFTMAIAPGQRFRASVASRDLGSALDAKLEIRNALGNRLDTRLGFSVPARGGVPEHASRDSTVEFTVPEGSMAVTIAVTGQWTDSPDSHELRSERCGGSGHVYRVTIVPMTPSFSLTLDDAQVSLSRGGTKEVKVTAWRDMFDGEIALRLTNPPPGLEFRGGVITRGQNIGSLTITASPDAEFKPTILDVIGEGEGSAGPIVAHARRILTFGEPTTEPFRTVVDRIEGIPVYSQFPAYLRTSPQTQTGLYVSIIK